MTSFSTYASRFLSSGASAGPIQHPSSSVAFKSSLYHPFRHDDSHSGTEDADEDDEAHDTYIDDESGVLKTQKSRQQFPQLHSRPSDPPESSRFFSQLLSGTSKPPMTPHNQSRSPGEDDEDLEDRDRGQRTKISIPTGGSSLIGDEQQTPNASSIYRDEHDPFLAEDDIQRATRSRSVSPTAHRTSSAQARTRGWMIHRTGSCTETEDSVHSRTPSRRHVLPDDIYRDPDEEERVSDPTRRPISDLGDADSSRSFVTDTSEEDEDVEDPRRRRRSDRRPSRISAITKAAGSIGSSLREPLLTSGFEEAAHLPGSYRGTTSRMTAADVYAYPHPPAQSGWTPWGPGNRVPIRQFKDKPALAMWIALVTFVLVFAGWMAIAAENFQPPSSPAVRPSPYFTLTRSIPILFLLTFLSLGAATANLLFLRNISRVGGGQLLRYGLIGVPAILGIGWVWAFAGSFMYDDERWKGGQWSTTGLRFISLLPLAAAIYFARAVWVRRNSLDRSLAVLELSARVVATHPSLLLLSLATLVAFLCITAPFLFIFVRLFLHGHFGRSSPGYAKDVWHTDTDARSMAWLTLAIWLWTWLVLRGIQRVTVAGTVSHWYFHREEESPRGDSKVFDANEDDPEETLPGPAPGHWLGEEQTSLGGPNHIEIVRASFIRATGPALGTICLSALILSAARVGTSMAATARWAHQKLSSWSRLPSILQPLTHLVALLAGISALLQGLSDYALIYVGVTGEGFMAAARRSSRLVTRQSAKSIVEGLIINILLDLTTLAICFLTGLIGFLFSAHNLHVPADAPLVGLLCALLPYWTLRLCADILTNAADTLFLCLSVDEASGEQHCKEATQAFAKTAGDGLPI